ncbi:Tat pathway signal protein [Fulvivirgaceae bacterium BMA10]|uniref:Tat pathway signal protein n=1 Tax=Splendidivirga corallicola TaxID=3051826 RepID=A0ABT8KIV0_9BACT|nr:Tat pathway signal protein [Fulvivirgaceae bacterium BMA10]
MDKRKFLKLSSLSALGLLHTNQLLSSSDPNMLKSSGVKKGTMKNWVWITPDTKASADDWKKRFAMMKEAGIDAILPEVYTGSGAYFESSRLPVRDAWLERLIPIARAMDLEIHTWMWTMPCLIPEIVEKHPKWYNVNRKGESSSTKPAYVNYYKFLCPSREPVHEFIKGTVKELSQYDVDGVHFDYVRHPDVILAEALQPKYNIVQDKEYPEYDYCYCENCRSLYKAQHGEDPLKMDDPSKSETWRQFRYDLISNLVNNKLIPEAKKQNKMVSAAVFPNWQNVRQEWHTWKLDAALPMLYHNFYNEDINWIKEQCAIGTKSLKYDTKLYSGLFVPQLSPGELSKAVKASMQGGASGISLFAFGSMKEAHWKALKTSIKKY